ncbi:phosphoribosylformimino-5-aminoimidazole carboxamide ribotide isomerase [Methylohalomonas lacus]|uniref:Phosphoribosylformimino-5-aminoimidazole carboxamide ribotide isomerase n=1 Tax=Methylohalomonas lacus TaxID=398773 RepID=A0AAE3HLC6_9GAMM|nr:HisA/HisF-related TIM barrel protein [Methylohalomonas lacus]MCS3904470.1 phosphoribosylformimino-5-aminoimidazole carboxamide ribotide isomerase [Methylohalomonas lacus]
MKIIPVIDIRAGQVVAARAGQRAGYQPLRSPLAESSEPLAVITGLRALYRFDTIYVADLDAIQGHNPQYALIEHLLEQLSDCAFWVDAGRIDNIPVLDNKRLRPVIGTENLATGETQKQLAQWPRAILSLDFMNETAIGDRDIHEHGEQWPADVIVMTLDQVGLNRGPDYERLQQLQRQAPDRHLYAAGGVRDDTDLQRLDDMGIHGALVSSALHRQTIRACRR